MKNIIKQNLSISKSDREKLLNQKSFVVWLTGLSGSGKSTISNELSKHLHEKKYLTYILDGDNVRLGLNNNLGFSDEDRKENIRRISEVCKLMNDAGVIIITAFISPFISDREMAKQIIGEKNFIEVYVDTPLSVCEKRDPKGLYEKARAGKIPMFTGIDSPYEAPTNPKLIIHTDDESLTPDISSKQILDFLNNQKYISSDEINEVDNLDKRKTISIDFDGVIHKYSKGFKGLENAYDEPMEDTEESLKKLIEQGYTLKILSSRPKDVIYPWLEKYNLSQYIDEVSNHKFPATVYIDDRGLLFTDWNQCLKDLNNHPKLKK